MTYLQDDTILNEKAEHSCHRPKGEEKRRRKTALRKGFSVSPPAESKDAQSWP